MDLSDLSNDASDDGFTAAILASSTGENLLIVADSTNMQLLIHK